jgi:hypothetical protein
MITRYAISHFETSLYRLLETDLFEEALVPVDWQDKTFGEDARSRIPAESIDA